MVAKVLWSALMMWVAVFNTGKCSASAFEELGIPHFSLPTDSGSVVFEIVQRSTVKVTEVCNGFQERYTSDERKLKSNGAISEDKSLREEFDRANRALAAVMCNLDPGAAEAADWISTLKELKQLTENGFYSTTVICSNYVEEASERSLVKDLISDFWQMLWQAREIATLKLGSNYTYTSQYEMNTLLVDTSSAIDQAIREGKVDDVDKAARFSQISYGIGAALGNEEARSEIQSSEEEAQIECSKSFFIAFVKDYEADLQDLGIQVVTN
jgi:hypothetical protein